MTDKLREALERILRRIELDKHVQVCGVDSDQSKVSELYRMPSIEDIARAALDAPSAGPVALTDAEIDAIEDSIMDPADFDGDSSAEDTHRKLMRRFARACIKSATHPPAAQAVAGEMPTEAMVTAYLEANDAYWRRTDELPRPPDKWRTGTPREATTESLRAALAAAPKGPVPDAWKPIETAPKDGRDIILYRRGVVHSAHWDKDYYNGGEWMSGKHVAAFGHIDPPTHWMPLPAAPKQEQTT